MSKNQMNVVATGQKIDRICDQFENEWMADQVPLIENFLDNSDDFRQQLIAELVAIDVSYRKSKGIECSVQGYVDRFPDAISELRPHLMSLFDGDVLTADETPGDTSIDPSAGSGRLRRLENIGKDFGPFELLEEIARGGMGVVFKARQKSTNRIVALKMILAGQFANELEIQRFFSEAEAIAKLDHPNIVPVYDAGEHNGYHYIAMAFVEGGSLADYCGDNPLEINTICSVVKTLAAAMHYAHEQNIIHRDLKPANILLSRGKQPRITDFGLARHIESDSELTKTGQIVGTPSFMAPEQAMSRQDLIGSTSDIYALGAILYNLLTGRPPFRATSVWDTLQQVLSDEPVPLRNLNPSIPKDVETICLKCLEKNPEFRYATGNELAAELGRFLNNEPIEARPISTSARALRWCGRNRVVASLLLGIAASMLIGSAAATYFALKSNTNAVMANESAELANRQSQNILTILEDVLLDTADRLEKIPAAQVARREILQQGMKSLELLTEDIKNDRRGLENSFDTLSKLADIYKRLGDDEGLSGTEKSLEFYDLAAQTGEEFLQQNGEEVPIMRKLCKCYFDYACLLIDTGRSDDATGMQTRNLEIANRIVALNNDPGSRFKDRSMLVKVQINCGERSAWNLRFVKDDVEKASKAAAAIVFFKQGLNTVQETFDLATEAGDLEALIVNEKNNANLNIWLGDVHLDLEQFDEAEVHYATALEISGEVAAADPTEDNQWDYVVALERTAEVFQATGRYEKALAAMEEAFEASRSRYEAHPDDNRYRLARATSYSQLGKANMYLKRGDEVVDAFSNSLAIRLPIGTADPSDLETQRLIVNAYQGIGLGHELNQDVEKAMKFYRKALDHLSNCDRESQDYLQENLTWLELRIQEAALPVVTYESILKAFEEMW